MSFVGIGEAKHADNLYPPFRNTINCCRLTCRGPRWPSLEKRSVSSTDSPLKLPPHFQHPQTNPEPRSNNNNILEHNPVQRNWEGWISHCEALLSRIGWLNNVCSGIMHLIHVVAIEEAIIGECQRLI